MGVIARRGVSFPLEVFAKMSSIYSVSVPGGQIDQTRKLS